MIDFTDYTMENIEEDMLEQVDDTFDKRTGSVIQTAIAPVAWYLEGLYLLLSQMQENAYAETAVGSYLDMIVPERGISRKQATPAVRQGTFNIQIPSGYLFKTINGENSVIFEVGNQLSSTADSYTYSMVCQTSGTIGNEYTGSILPVTAVAGLTSATIGMIITAGTDEETDEALRERYFETFATPSFAGNITAYRTEILSIAGVGAVQVYPAYQGGGTVLCSILDDNLEPALPVLVQSVQDIVCPSADGYNVPSADGYGFAPIGAAVTITTGTELTLDVTCTVVFQNGIVNGSSIYQSAIEDEIRAYIQTVRETWGNALVAHQVSYPVTVYISRIIAAVLNVPEIVSVTSLLVNGSASDIVCTETSALQDVPTLGTVIVNE